MTKRTSSLPKHSKRDVAIGFFAGIYGFILLFVMINGLVVNIKEDGALGFKFFYAFTNQTNLFCSI
jgi:hypothetical protein